MILVISDGGIKTKEMSKVLDVVGIDYIFYFSSFSSAGAFGQGNAIVGKMSYKSFERIIKLNKVNCIIDIISAPRSEISYIAITAAKDMGIPLIKFVSPTLFLKMSLLDKLNIDCSVEYSYNKVANKINNTIGNVMFFAKPYNVKTIADKVFDRNALYTPISGGIEYDVELALEYGIPLFNVRDFGDVSGAMGIENALNSVDAKLIVTDDSYDLLDKLEAASKTNTDIVFTQNTGYDYDYFLDDYDDLYNTLVDLAVIESSEDNQDDEDQNDEKQEGSVD